jgi:hypothetical protein
MTKIEHTHGATEPRACEDGNGLTESGKLTAQTQSGTKMSNVKNAQTGAALSHSV